MTRHADDWARYGVLTRLASELGDQHRFGKKAMQKVVYLLQESLGVPLGFRYTFYTYGVFSAELANAVDIVESLDGISAKYDRIDNSYQLSQGSVANEIEKRASSFLFEFADRIAEVISFAKGKPGKSLELMSTIVFVTREEGVSPAERDRLIERVHALKPKFSVETIEQAIQELEAAGGFLPS